MTHPEMGTLEDLLATQGAAAAQMLAEARVAVQADKQRRADAVSAALQVLLAEQRCDLIVEVTMTSHAGTTFTIRPRALD